MADKYHRKVGVGFEDSSQFLDLSGDDAAVCSGSRIPTAAESSRATGAISPGAPGPPWTTAMRKGLLPYVLKLIIPLKSNAT